MLYLSGSYHTIPDEHRAYFGYMLNVNKRMAHEPLALQHPWMLDNGAYGDKWDELRWRKGLRRLQPHNANCIAAVVPDVVFDAHATLVRWHKYAKVVKAMGYRAAFVTQNGLDISDVPWDELDVLMIGGDLTHKRIEAQPLRAAAKARGKWLHVARINSVEALRGCKDADSVDGNHFMFGLRPGEMQAWCRIMDRINMHQKVHTACK